MSLWATVSLQLDMGILTDRAQSAQQPSLHVRTHSRCPCPGLSCGLRPRPGHGALQASGQRDVAGRSVPWPGPHAMLGAGVSHCPVRPWRGAGWGAATSPLKPALGQPSQPPSVRWGPRVQPTPQHLHCAEHGVPGFCSLCFAGNCVERGPTGSIPIKGSGHISSPGHCPHRGPRPVSCLFLQLCSRPLARGGFPRASPTVPSTPRLCTCTSILHRAPQHYTVPQLHRCILTAVCPVTEQPNSAHYAPTPQNALQRHRMLPKSAQCTPTLHGAPQLHRAYDNLQSTHCAAHPTGLQRKKAQVWGLSTQGSLPEAAAGDRPAALPVRHSSEPPGL